MKKELCEYCGGEGEIETMMLGYKNELLYDTAKCEECNPPSEEDCYDPDN